jgi:hypothetical protein
MVLSIRNAINKLQINDQFEVDEQAIDLVNTSVADLVAYCKKVGIIFESPRRDQVITAILIARPHFIDDIEKDYYKEGIIAICNYIGASPKGTIYLLKFNIKERLAILQGGNITASESKTIENSAAEDDNDYVSSDPDLNVTDDRPKLIHYCNTHGIPFSTNMTTKELIIRILRRKRNILQNLDKEYTPEAIKDIAEKLDLSSYGSIEDVIARIQARVARK